MQTVFYARVSTTEQSIEHQITQARNAGFQIDHVVADHGVSGVSVKMRDRPEGRRLFDMLRKGDILLVRWVDRLGRNYEDVTDTIREFIRQGVTVRTIINGMVFDGQPENPMQAAVRDALIAFMAASAQAQAEATKEAQRAGIAAAKANEEAGAYLGRKPKFTATDVENVRALLSKGTSISEISKAVGLPRATVYRIKDNPAETDAALLRWNLKPRTSASTTTYEEEEV